MLSTAQTANIETRDIAALNTAQIAALRTFNVSTLTTDQLVALSTAQISAVTKALQSVAILMLEGHLAECVTNAMDDNTVDMNEKLSEVTAAIARLVRS